MADGLVLRRVKERPVYCRKLLQKQYNTSLNGVANCVCAMLEVVGVADLKYEDVQDLPALLERTSSNTLNF